MKTVLVLSILLCAALAAPAEDKAKAPEAAVEALKEQVEAAAPEMEDNVMMMKEEEVFVPEDAVPVPMNARVLEEEAAPESRYNFCPGGWHPHGSRCFLFVNTPMNWSNAENHCRNLGAHLASVTNPREYSFLQQITPASRTQAWLGGFNLQGAWMWIDGEGFYYTNWFIQSSSSSSICIYLQTNGGWRNTACGYGYPFICSQNPFSC